MTEEIDREKAGRSRRHWALWIVSAVAPVVLLFVFEAALRLFGVGYPTALTVPCTKEGRAADCYNLFFPAPFFPPGMIRTPQVYAIPAEKPVGTFRVFVLGESAAMGDPDPAYGFSRYLEVMLQQRYPSMNFEFVNTGSAAINSHMLLPIAKGLAEHAPDVFIIYSGNNEVVGPYGPGTALVSSSMKLPVIRASILARSTRVGQLLTKLGAEKKEWRGMEMFLEKQVPASSPLMWYVYENYDRNLRDTIAAARSARARVIVSTVATNVKDCAPFASMHRGGLGPDDLRSWTALVQKGADLESAHSYAEALQTYQSAAKIDDEYAELQFRIARILWKQGDSARAKEHFLRARDLDTLRFRADSRINEINRSVASSTTGTELVDVEDLFSKQSPDGLIGSNLIYEHVHITALGNYLLARAMFWQIANRMPAEAGHALTEADVPSEADCERLLALTPHDRRRLSGEMLDRLQKPPFTSQLNHSEQLLRLAFQAEVPDENPVQTSTEYQWAIAQRPKDRYLRYNYGNFLFGYDRNAGVAQLLQSRPWDGFPVLLPDGGLIE